jgi:LysR family nod box-dependent transcriptional activator
MQFHRFDLNLLIALDTLLREKNITRAAEKVFVSQPAMSAALHRLRDYFDDPLLIRVGRDMELSPRGQSLVEPVREALLLIQATLGTQPTFTAATTQREFTLILSEEAVPGLLPAILERVSREAPGIRINIELVSHTALNRLEYGDVDLCLCLDCLRLFEVRAFPETLRGVRLRPVRWICAVDRDHPTVDDRMTAEQYGFDRRVGAPPAGHRFAGAHFRAQPAAFAAGAARHGTLRHPAGARRADVYRDPAGQDVSVAVRDSSDARGSVVAQAQRKRSRTRVAAGSRG